MTKFLIGAAALALVAPAVAQVAPVAPVAPVKAPRVHTRAEIQTTTAQMFARLDVNRDGFLTKAEADAARAQRVPVKIAARRSTASTPIATAPSAGRSGMPSASSVVRTRAPTLGAAECAGCTGSAAACSKWPTPTATDACLCRRLSLRHSSIST